MSDWEGRFEIEYWPSFVKSSKDKGRYLSQSERELVLSFLKHVDRLVTEQMHQAKQPIIAPDILEGGPDD